MFFTHLTRRALISLTGEDAMPFLQGLISNDIQKLAPAKALYAALLTPQGKYLHDFFLYQNKDLIWLDSEAAKQADLKQRLMLYKLRSKVAIEILPQTEGVVAVWGDVAQGMVADPRLPELGYRMAGVVSENIAYCSKQGWQQVDEAAYEAMRISLGVPDGAQDMTADKSFLLEFGFEPLHGVDFQKGCYVGQEVTARTKHRGGLKRFIYMVESETALAPRTPVTQAGETIGEILSVQGTRALALLRAEAVEHGKLFARDIPVYAKLPHWAQGTKV